MSRPASTSMSWMSGSPTTKRRAVPTAIAIFMPSCTSIPPGVRTVPTRSMTSCIASPHAAPRAPSSPSSQHVIASPLK
jgi:hypothetical protein